MSSRQVEAFWVFRYTMSHYKALYGRNIKGNGDKSYSKDFLQVKGACEAEFERIIGRALAPRDQVPFTYRWPGGKMDGKITRTSDRLNLRWPTTGHAPDPWRLALKVTRNSTETFEGNPGLTTTRDATAEWHRFDSQNLDPWLVVVKLRDEPGVLHLRAYLGKPPAHLQHCSTAPLPTVVRDLMDNLRRSRGACGVLSLGNQIALSPDLHRLLAMVNTSPGPQIVGPHNLGKASDEKLTELLENTADILWFDPNRNHDAFHQSP